MPTKTNDFYKQLQRLKRDKQVLWLGILFFVLVVFWILTIILTTSKTSTIDPDLIELARPFIPRLESNIFEEILQQRVFDEGELSHFPIYALSKNTAEIDVVDITLDNAFFTSPEPTQNGNTEFKLDQGLDFDVDNFPNLDSGSDSTETAVEVNEVGYEEESINQ